MEIKCLRCGSDKYVKDGKVFGWQRYKCKQCGYQFSKIGERGKPFNIKLTCHGLYLFGLSMRQIAKVVGVSAQTVSRWIKKWHQTYMFEIGEHETRYKTTSENLIACLNIKDDDKLMVTSQRLNSGAEIHIVIKLPSSDT